MKADEDRYSKTTIAHLKHVFLWNIYMYFDALGAIGCHGCHGVMERSY